MWTRISQFVADAWRNDTERVSFFDGENGYKGGFIRVVGDSRTAVLVIPDRDGEMGYSAWKRELFDWECADRGELERSLGEWRVSEAYRGHILTYGTDEQVSALNDGSLSQEDGWKMIRDSVFQNLERKLKRFYQIQWKDVTGAKRSSDVVFSCGDVIPRGMGMKLLHQSAHDALSGEGTFTWKWHRAHVDGVLALERFSLRASVDWHGRVLVRQYEIPAEMVCDDDLRP